MQYAWSKGAEMPKSITVPNTILRIFLLVVAYHSCVFVLKNEYLY